MLSRKRYQPAFKIICLAAFLLTAPVLAQVIPVDLPPPDANPVAKDKPVKVYILSGQSNMLGFGRVDGTKPFYPYVFLSADPSVQPTRLPVNDAAVLPFGVFKSSDPEATPGGTASIYRGAYDPKADYAAMKPVREQDIALGAVSADLPTIDGPHTVVVRAYIEVPYDGSYTIQPGMGPSRHAVVQLDGLEVYRMEPGAEAVRGKASLKAGQRYPIQITYLESGSAALWMEMVDRKGMGDLRWVVNELGRFRNLIDAEGNWTVRPDVMLNDAYMGKGKSEPLSAAACGPTFGPELGFGFVMGTFHDEPVIVMKADIGNRSLGWDILPPGSESYTYDGIVHPGYGETMETAGSGKKYEGDGWYAGKQYDDFTASIRAVLDNFAQRYPEYAEQGFEVAGFVWWQGHKDGPNPAHNSRYEQNMVNLIKAWRKEFNAPNAPWAIATVGFHGDNMPEHYVRIAEAQLAVADPQRHPELAGTVKTIDTRPFWRGPEVSPMNQDYHYNHNAETYMLTGDALGRAMVELKGGKVEYPSGQLHPSVKAIPFMAPATREQVEQISVAMQPIVLDRLIPDYVAAAPGTPAYRRHGLPIQSIVHGQAPDKLSALLTSQLDELNNYYDLIGIRDYRWQRFGPPMQQAQWYYHTFDPPERKEDSKGDRYRAVTLPEGMDHWYAVDFDPAAAGWSLGQAPFGQRDGRQVALRADCSNPHCGCSITPNTLWDKEVLLIRQRFEIPAFDPSKRYRIVVGGAGHTWSGEGFALYVNGNLVSEATGGYYKDGGGARGTYIHKALQPQVESSTVTIAVKAFLRQNHHRNHPAPPSGHLSVWMEEATLPPSVLSLMEAPAP
jgi:hypothetical protein